MRLVLAVLDVNLRARSLVIQRLVDAVNLAVIPQQCHLRDDSLVEAVEDVLQESRVSVTAKSSRVRLGCTPQQLDLVAFAVVLGDHEDEMPPFGDRDFEHALDVREVRLLGQYVLHAHAQVLLVALAAVSCHARNVQLALPQDLTESLGLADVVLLSQLRLEVRRRVALFVGGRTSTRPSRRTTSGRPCETWCLPPPRRCAGEPPLPGQWQKGTPCPPGL
ncbi:unnamed protein product [Phaeothamnion confervicola]